MKIEKIKEMETPITKQIADRLEELAVQWKDHTSQAEALMMAAKEVMTFQEEEKEQIKQSWVSAWQDSMINPKEYRFYEPDAEQYYNETFGGNNEQ